MRSLMQSDIGYLNVGDQNKLKEILNYIIKSEDLEVAYGYETTITIKRKVKVNGSTYSNRLETFSNLVALFWIIPWYFDVKISDINISDYRAVLDFYYNLYKQRIESEEVSEEMPRLEEQI